MQYQQNPNEVKQWKNQCKLFNFINNVNSIKKILDPVYLPVKLVVSGCSVATVRERSCSCCYCYCLLKWNDSGALLNGSILQQFNFLPKEANLHENCLESTITHTHSLYICASIFSTGMTYSISKATGMKSKLLGKIIFYSNFLEKEPFPRKAYHYRPTSSSMSSAADFYLHSYSPSMKAPLRA